MLHKIQAVSPDDVLTINIDVPGAVMATLGRLPRLSTLREELIKKLPNWNVDSLDSLDECARAAGHAYSLHAAATTPPADLAEIAAKATETRAALVADATALAHHGLIERRPIDDLKGPVGYKNVAFDILVLDHLFRAAWPEIEGKTVVTLQRLDAATIEADQLLVAAGIKKVSTRNIAEAALIRDQAFTLFVRTYDEVRRAVVFARWHEDDADQFAPSLYAGRRRSSNSDEETEPSPEQPAEVAPPAPAPTTPETPHVPATEAQVVPGGGPFVA
jgi:hypothetical protein